jgi:hypothetical protein
VSAGSCFATCMACELCARAGPPLSCAVCEQRRGALVRLALVAQEASALKARVHVLTQHSLGHTLADNVTALQTRTDAQNGDPRSPPEPLVPVAGALPAEAAVMSPQCSGDFCLRGAARADVTRPWPSLRSKPARTAEKEKARNSTKPEAIARPAAAQTPAGAAIETQ